MSGIATISSEGAFDAAIRKAINSNFNTLGGAIVAVGNVFFLNPASGNDSNDGASSATPLQTLTGAFARCTAGNNDTVVLISNGATSSFARVDAAFTWNKAATHLVGYCAPTLLGQRASIRPTGTTTAFANFFTISASGCIFQNIEIFDGFNTGTTAQIAVTITGSRNTFTNCQLAGMGDATSAGDAGSRSLKIGSAGSGENLFLNCTIGLDTVARGAANASIEFAGATARNIFRNCVLPVDASASSPLVILGTGANCVDRFNQFENCSFLNAIKSGGTQMTVLGSFTSASPGGMVTFRSCSGAGFTKFGDTNFLANSFIDMPAVSASAGGLMIAAT